ncbi:MAG: adenosylmethionine--8-amino-7-oxononanoate transaminase [Cytophagaceae bacterium]|nr:adenosylmethionine--8-amino-7-oxononanoate transaminase [Cytophagaceae bacterium]MDW8455521.1 adenosylmethionine--8-amino-7-oxononanoate transaminase [Cytophagaceae bacterium]
MSKSYTELDKQYIWHPYSPLEYGDNIVVKSAQGVYLHTCDGRKILDAISSWWVNLHGHAHPHISKAVAHQAATMEHVIFAGFTHPPAIQLAHSLCNILPGDMKKIFFSDNGSTSVEVALKMAIQYHAIKKQHRHKIIALHGAYHGDTFGAMAVSERGIFNQHFHQYLFEVEYIPFPDAQKEDEILNILFTKLKNNSYAAFIYEPLLQGVSGMRTYSASWLDKAIHLCKEHDILCIADEVLTGFGRTGRLFASEYMNNKPDIICLSKGLTGGYMPMGATACNARVSDVFTFNGSKSIFYHGHSYTANPLSCAAANASLELLLEDSCQEKIQRITKWQREFFNEIRSHPKVNSAHTLGTILSLELKSEHATEYHNVLKTQIYNFFIERNILLRPLGNIMYILPPYAIEEKELKNIFHNIHAFLSKI